MASTPSHTGSRRTFEQAFGQVLRALREERGLSQEQLGHQIESGRTYISHLERGEKGPSLKMVFRLAAGLAYSPSEIVDHVEAAVERAGR